MAIPSIRLRQANGQSLNADGDYVLYWMVAFRRSRSNFALQHAVDRAVEFGKPLVIFEPLRVRYRWASDRLHRFVIEGMRDNADAFQKKSVTYFPYVEPRPVSGSPLLHALAKNACTVVTDDYPCFFLPRMFDLVKDRVSVPLELVDSNTVIPMRAAERTFTVAHSYRRWMQKNILDALTDLPADDPLARKKLPKLDALPAAITNRWKPANFETLLSGNGLQSIPIDHDVTPSRVVEGGSIDARKRIIRFLKSRMGRYSDERNHPDNHVTTGLSPHLHFGHISPHDIVLSVLDAESWTPDLAGKPNGKKRGFWNISESAEAFLDQMLTWREMGFNFSHREPEHYDQFESLPDWAKKTLSESKCDPRPTTYTLEQFEAAETHDEIWNAGQRELVQTGVMHNYIRMLWGKKILHWTQSPRQALQIMIHLNNKYGLDGRDPNSYSGIFWVLGRYDRAWWPKRPVFGSVRYMTSNSTRKKLRLKEYLARFGP